MKFLITASNYVIPLMFFFIIVHGYLNRVKLFDSFTEGAFDGFKTILNVMPTILGLMVAVSILRASGAFDLFVALVSPVTDAFGFPSDSVPLTLMRLVSSSASTGLLLDIFKTHGADSFIGRYVSIMMSCTETVFYTMSIYFLSVKVTKTRYTLHGAILANVVGVIASFYITKLVFY